MEDEDGESKVIDMWNILEEQRLKDSTLDNSLKHSIDDVYTAVIEDEKQLIRSIISNDSPGKNTITGPNFVFKGFKKRILAEAREVPTATSKNSTPELRQLTNLNARTGKDKRVERKQKRKITEYAQYLGLRPSSRYKCTKCHAWSGYGPNSRQNSCACNPSMTPMASTSEPSASVPYASNFKITRKVYLCSACGTYFENWNLFLHMRDTHKRHICLYCLGMFGQAERLSYHLMKKHSVPEMAFSSMEDFYNAFKGSCYLICCSCEKVFSETDDFFNHFCSPVLEQDSTVTVASMCTICRQTGTHASTCNFTLPSDTDKEVCSTSTPLAVADAMYADNASPAMIPPSETITNLGGKGLPRKMIKYNRRKHERDDMQHSHQQKPNALTKKLSAKFQCNETQLDCNLDVQRETANSLPRDTVTETIMEVSRYTGGNSSDENDENDEQAVNKDVHNNHRGSGGKSPVQNCQLDFSEPYDSVTETIMEVSRYTGEEIKNEREDATYTLNACASHMIEKTNTEDEEICDKSDVDLTHSASSRTPSPMQFDTEEITIDTKARVMCETETKYGSPQDARSCSPVNRSLFSPQHESHISDQQSKEIESFENIDKKVEKPVVTNTTESQASVSFNAVASSDRSLIIKIRNRNSQFSVATTTVTSRESEENNNAEGSTSKERMPNGSETGRDIIDDDQVNELDDSDSDSDKLAVVDSNLEEDEEAEDDEEGEADETEDRHDEVEGKGQRNPEENDEVKTGTCTDELFSITETLPIDNTNETSVNNAVEDVANEQTKNHTIDNSGIVLAGEDVPCIDLNVEGTLDSMELEDLLKRCIEAASPICVYCNHARYIAVNGKQLGLHMLAEHKFQPQHPAIIIHAEQFTARVKRSLDELESRYFNLDTYNSTNGTYNVPNVLIYECFHCRFHSTVHKELYLHNRKMHQKTILICIMCKSTFYSYSELVCHLCPGVYSPNVNLRYRCCLCPVANLPSAFRLMVHVRKRHHACDVCLESTGNQQRLSNHVWKHKLHHLCYRCGIAYRNKPDITKHLFWKHGTESVLCRKCLQKKWPHIYHFCIPPTAFVCEECGLSFGRAVALKVHKRLHSGDSPYGCDECEQRFISRKLLAKHQATHREPEPEDVHVNVTNVVNTSLTDKDEKSDRNTSVTMTDGDPTVGVETTSKNVKEAVKKVVDVYDLPPLNLSSESDTDSEEEKPASTDKLPEKENIDEDAAKKNETTTETIAVNDDDSVVLNNDIVEVERNEEEKKQEARIMDGIWDNFKTYAASLDVEESAKNVALKESVPETDAAYLRSIVFSDHDYCVVNSSDKEKNEDQVISKDNDTKANDTKSERSPSPGTPSRNTGGDSDANKRKVKTPKKKKRSGSTSSTSDSSSDTDSSSCSCGTNCSCSSSSSGSSSSSSSSSDSDSSASENSPRKQSSNRKDRNKKEREATRENKSQSVEPENKPEDKPENKLEDKPEIAIENGSVVPEIMREPSPAKPLLRESDLETEETETDEDFYDEYPQLLANKLMAEKRNQLLLLATVAPASTPISTPTSTPTSTLIPTMDQPSMPLNNGVLVAETAPDSITMTIENQQPQQQQQQQRRKTKTKKRRKGERGGKRNATTTATVESIKLNIPKALYQKNPGFVASSQSTLALHSNNRSLTPNLSSAATCNDFNSSNAVSIAIEMQQQQQASSATAVMDVSNKNVSGTEAKNKRVSKRKRVPKRFYGDSSDDEPQEKQSFSRWRKMDTTTPTIATTIPAFAPLPPTTIMTPPNLKPLVSRLSLSGKTIQTYGNRSAQVEQAVIQQQTALPEASPIVTTISATESEGHAESSSDSSESETENIVNQSKINPTILPVGAPTAERPGKIYCYCRCPYDEVSEMIACDGEDCRIEWFHFECVGIMVPPKGRWYCPDCRKRHDIVQNDEYCD
ncbi:PREDICTED: uncharacterized protein LOC108781512 [Cyphomyrmex costatus]|uniref:Transcriptional regulatory protein PHO23 n=1 Tax=Cyphomyrmex costatus TaxID=456900 RepID=A0A151I7Y0_9HYME|nr:PREDICTED: uncharacterized protein LOC108781512 [Cyphomyrmex costatus]KYM94218.1 Transcriptional regulatory protein PHO23 [Cyphomyrmex costatus]